MDMNNPDFQEAMKSMMNNPEMMKNVMDIMQDPEQMKNIMSMMGGMMPNMVPNMQNEDQLPNNNEIKEEQKGSVGITSSEGKEINREELKFNKNDKIQLQGLKNNEYNQKNGVIESYNSDSSRYTVLIEELERVISVKEDNILLLVD